MNNIKNLIRKIIFGKDSDDYLRIHIKYNKTNNVLLKCNYFLQLKKIERKFNGCIPLTAKIGKGIQLPHGLYGVFISKNAIIGDNCTIFHQVTIGANTIETSKKYGSPKIGNNVYIGAGAKIIGNVKIGNNVRIGANCVVVDDIDDDCTVVLPKIRIIKKGMIK